MSGGTSEEGRGNLAELLPNQKRTGTIQGKEVRPQELRNHGEKACVQGFHFRKEIGRLDF